MTKKQTSAEAGKKLAEELKASKEKIEAEKESPEEQKKRVGEMLEKYAGITEVKELATQILNAINTGRINVDVTININREMKQGAAIHLKSSGERQFDKKGNIIPEYQKKHGLVAVEDLKEFAALAEGQELSQDDVKKYVRWNFGCDITSLPVSKVDELKELFRLGSVRDGLPF